MLKKKKCLPESEGIKKAKMNDGLTTLRYSNPRYFKSIPSVKIVFTREGRKHCLPHEMSYNKNNEEWVSTWQLSGRQAYTNKTIKCGVTYLTNVVQEMIIKC